VGAQDIILDGLHKIRPEAFKVINLPNRIFILGGITNGKDEHPTTMRGQFLSLCMKTSLSYDWLEAIITPEDYLDWWAFSGYDNLLEFERDACLLSHGVVLFPESPGSYSELGLLSGDEDISEKMIVVVDNAYLEGADSRSFIYLGPLRIARDKDLECGIMGISSCNKDADFYEISKFIDKISRTRQKEVLFNKKNRDHVFLLIADIVDIVLIITKIKLHSLLKETFTVDIEIGRTEQILSILCFFELINKIKVGSTIYYTQNKNGDPPFVIYNTGDARLNRAVTKTGNLYELEKDTRLFEIYMRAIK
jgi:hypothetical protein